jgi:hypothetical protein
MAGPANFLLQQIAQGAQPRMADAAARGYQQGNAMLQMQQMQQDRNALAQIAKARATGGLQAGIQTAGQLGQYEPLNQMDTVLYGRGRDTTNDAFRNKQFDYGVQRDQVGDQQWRQTFAANEAQREFQRQQANSGGEQTFGLNPIYGRDADGNVVLLQASNRGGVQPVQLPPGVQPSMPVQYLDTGTGFVPVDKRGGGIVGPEVTKNIGEAEAQKVQGKVAGEQAVKAPQVLAEARQSLSLIGTMKAHPGRAMATGATSWTALIPGTPAYDFATAAKQLEGRVFLEQFEKLKGAGPVTDREGAAATAAAARLDRAQSPKAYYEALLELEGVFNQTVSRLERDMAAGQGRAQGGQGQTQGGLKYRVVE